MNTNPDAPAGPSIQLTEDLLKTLGLTCLWVDSTIPGLDHVRLSKRTIVGRRAIGEKIWFRSDEEAGEVYEAVLSRCRAATRTKDGLVIKMAPDEVEAMVHKVARSIGHYPIKDAHVAVTFDSIKGRIDKVLARFRTDGTMKRLHLEYISLSEKEVAIKAANRVSNAWARDAYNELGKPERDRLKTEYAAAKLNDPATNWNRFLEGKLDLPKTESPSIASGTIERDKAGTNGTIVSSYNKWLVSRLGKELLACTELVHFTKS